MANRLIFHDVLNKAVKNFIAKPIINLDVIKNAIMVNILRQLRCACYKVCYILLPRKLRQCCVKFLKVFRMVQTSVNVNYAAY